MKSLRLMGIEPVPIQDSKRFVIKVYIYEKDGQRIVEQMMKFERKEMRNHNYSEEDVINAFRNALASNGVDITPYPNYPDCDNCKHHRNTDDNMAACAHPSIQEIRKAGSAILSSFKILGHFGNGSPLYTQSSNLMVVANPDAIERGLFEWPLRFDARYIVNCDGFDPMNTEAETAVSDTGKHKK